MIVCQGNSGIIAQELMTINIIDLDKGTSFEMLDHDVVLQEGEEIFVDEGGYIQEYVIGRIDTVLRKEGSSASVIINIFAKKKTLLPKLGTILN